MSKKLAFLISLAVLATTFSSSVHAISGWRGGIVNSIYTDPSDIVVVMNGAAGPCGSNYYHIQRSNTNFKELYALVLTAFTAGKSINVAIIGCAGDRNIVSHGQIF